ncbi:type II secretion system protein GspG [Lignipirellula cremea]|uniref:Bacterial type II secretion system protein G n=1 Tax=Lignipirellula cremea TaxID=2528010 RepID=A0A518DT84_9BACT|nr:type II secretion system protein GspG [Lignipirellula cremea]QDU95051.1 Bacterial type II secretion system protein G [Lignipirellula cremea]
MPSRPTWLALFPLGVVLLGASCQSLSLVDRIPHTATTQTRLQGTQHRLHQYWQQHGRVPLSPEDLPDEAGRDGSLVDGWGRPFYWNSDGISQVTVGSYGRDGKPGGENEDADSLIEYVGGRDP